MSYPGGGGPGDGGDGDGEPVGFCPARADLAWSQTQYNHVEFADFNQVQVAQYGEVKYFQGQSDDENAPEVEGEFFPMTPFSLVFVGFSLITAIPSPMLTTPLQTTKRRPR